VAHCPLCRRRALTPPSFEAHVEDEDVEREEEEGVGEGVQGIDDISDYGLLARQVERGDGGVGGRGEGIKGGGRIVVHFL